MKSFLRYLEEKKRSRVVDEALTIPENPEDKVELDIRKKMKKGYVHGDRVIRWYRNAKKSGEPVSSLVSSFASNFSNIEDLLKTYEKYLADLKRMKMLKKVDISFQGGKTLSVDPVKDVDKIRRLEGFQMLVKAMGDLVHSDEAISSDVQKYAVDAEDRKKIKILGSSANVVLWQTQGYETTNKFVYQLWQNAETLGRGDVYGDPVNQTPYCTHSKQHWDDYSSKFGSSYKQFWFLEKQSGVSYPAGDLTSPGVVKAFNAMKGMGYDILIGMNDSGNDMLDNYDESVEGWAKVLRGQWSVSDIDHLRHAGEVVDLTKKILYFKQQEHEFLPATTVVDPDKKKSTGDTKPKPTPKHFTGRRIEVICSDYRSWDVPNDTAMRHKMEAMHFPKSVDVTMFDIEENYASMSPVAMPYLPDKVKAGFFSLKNIELVKPMEVECGNNMELSQLDQKSCDMLQIAQTKLYVTLSDMHIDNLKFLPQTTRSLVIGSSASVKSYDGAPLGGDMLVDIRSGSSSERGIADTEFDVVMRLLCGLDSKMREKVRSVWQRDGRFHSIISEVGEAATDTILDFVDWLFTPNKKSDGDGRRGKDLLDWWTQNWVYGKKHKDYDARAYEFLHSNGFI